MALPPAAILIFVTVAVNNLTFKHVKDTSTNKKNKKNGALKSHVAEVFEDKIASSHRKKFDVQVTQIAKERAFIA